jgi:aminobenzoyl-glutamate utilization protein B
MTPVILSERRGRRIYFRPMVARLALVAAIAAPLHAQVSQAGKSVLDGVLGTLDSKRDHYADVAKQIWGFAELGYQEQKSSALLQSELTSAGFAVKSGVADIPTAFVASYGSGKPIIAIVGEFDALPGLSQAAVPTRQPIANSVAGHACGHNLFGTASTAAAIAVKQWLESQHKTGTVRFYGTPAEEGGSGKVYMVRAGLFNDVDAVVTWHPGDRNDVSPVSNLANIGAKFRFHGIAAHAAAAPDKGRSALDAVEAMDNMMNMMREHVPQETRIHYVITDGGKAPNVVPEAAEVYYVARHPDIRVLDGIWERIVNAAKGAALGTGTTMDMEIISAVYNVLPNDYLSGLQRKNLEKVGGIVYTPEEHAFAEEIRKTLTEPMLPLGSEAQIQPVRNEVTFASTDMGDVSWAVPTVQLSTATWVPGTPAHSWQAVAAGGTSIGTKGMMVAAKTMTLTAIDLFTDPSHIQKARAEFDRRRGGFTYKSRLDRAKPALDYRKSGQ